MPGASAGPGAPGVLTAYIVLLVALPSRFVVGPLGGAGTPSLLLGVGCLIWWVLGRVRHEVAGPPSSAAQRGPLLSVGAVLGVSVVLSYVAACLRPTTEAELNVATLGLIGVAGWTGVFVLAHDGLRDENQVRVVMRRLVQAGTLLAAFGLFQFVTHEAWTDRISIPGLSINNVLYGVQTRGGFVRPTGTAIHPIEFGVVLSMLLPLAVARAASQRPSSGGLRLVAGWLSPLIMVVAIALSSSRSALVCAAIGVAILMFRIPAHLRGAAAVALAAVGAFVFVAVPGMLGGILGLFVGVADDTSAQSRVDAYGVALSFISHSPLFGRGFGTFDPRYRIFDNQYVLSAVEIGIVGTALLVAWFACSVVVGHRASLRFVAAEHRLSAQALSGAVAAGAVSFALFDALSFPMAAGLLFLLLGLTSAVGQLSRVAQLAPAVILTQVKGAGPASKRDRAQAGEQVARSGSLPSVAPPRSLEAPSSPR